MSRWKKAPLRTKLTVLLLRQRGSAGDLGQILHYDCDNAQALITLDMVLGTALNNFWQLPLGSLCADDYLDLYCKNITCGWMMYQLS